ncbi:hypothetical protein ADIS_1193 [Lunatimonas lonarensis]|uniref:OmpA-like domain-containing protein n=2 Tax=Lunatimonas lonarensis TaxID=1232681 RepID=R7ZW02_9BACT|nr:hypothetical protein ADIS_1193 [Lunatimonas lonarensis]
MVLLAWPTRAQMDPYNYRLGLGVGYTNYYGDLSPFRIRGFENLMRLYDYNPQYIPGRSYALSLERRLSNSIGIMVQGGSYRFGMSDRFADRNGTLQTHLPNFNRALNFQTELRDLGLGLVFRTDNDRILNKHAFIAPYITLGFGISQFDVYGDLLDDQGITYDYQDPNVQPNGLFETSLREIKTELENGYGRHAWYYGLGLGVRFRIAKQAELFVQSDFRHSSSDYLDDVSGLYRNDYDNEFQLYAALPGTNFPGTENPYRGDPNGRNDWYIFHQAGLRISFKPSKQAFRASRISPSRSMMQADGSAAKPTPKTDTVRETVEPNPAQTGDQFFNFFQINPQQSGEPRLQQKVALLDQRILVLETRQQISTYDADLASLAFQMDSLNVLGSELISKPDPTEAELVTLDEIKRNQEMLSGRYGTTQSDREQAFLTLQHTERRLDSLEAVVASMPAEEEPLDTLVFIRGFQQFSEQVARALNQPGNWLQPQPPYQSTRDVGSFSDVSELGARRFAPDTGTYRSPLGYDSYSAYAPFDRPLYVYPETSPPVIRERNRTRLRQRTEITPPNEYYQQTQPFAAPPTSTAPGVAGPTAGATTIAPVFIPGLARDGDSEAESQLPSEQPNQRDLATELIPSPNQPLAAWKIERDTVVIDKKVVVGFPVSKKEVYFDTNRADLSKKEVEKLDEVVALLRNHDNYFVALTGFTDNTGSIRYNLSLAEKRVAHVKELLIKQGDIDPDRVITKPAGLLVRDTRGGSRPEDRKVEILIEVIID